MTIQELAKKYLCEFTLDTRKNGEKFWHTGLDTQESLTMLIRAAHGDHMPDDYKYQYIVESLQAIAILEDGKSWEECYTECDVYTCDLTDWLASKVYRHDYTDRILEDGFCANTFDLLQSAQSLERSEILESVYNSLLNETQI